MSTTASNKYKPIHCNSKQDNTNTAIPADDKIEMRTTATMTKYVYANSNSIEACHYRPPQHRSTIEQTGF